MIPLGLGDQLWLPHIKLPEERVRSDVQIGKVLAIVLFTVALPGEWQESGKLGKLLVKTLLPPLPAPFPDISAVPTPIPSTLNCQGTALLSPLAIPFQYQRATDQGQRGTYLYRPHPFLAPLLLPSYCPDDNWERPWFVLSRPGLNSNLKSDSVPLLPGTVTQLF